MSRADVLTDGTAKAIKAHDKTGVKLGCWPAPAPAPAPAPSPAQPHAPK